MLYYTTSTRKDVYVLNGYTNFIIKNLSIKRDIDDYKQYNFLYRSTLNKFKKQHHLKLYNSSNTYNYIEYGTYQDLDFYSFNNNKENYTIEGIYMGTAVGY